MRIKFKSLSGFGFLSYKNNFNIDFENYERKLVQILGNKDDESFSNSNGSGKSSLFEAVSWVLFGRLSRGNKYSDDVINWNSNKTSVSLSIEADSNLYTITREKTKGKTAKITISPFNESLRESTTSYIQNKIESIIGLDYTAFHNSILFSQGSKGFVSLRPMDRHAILNNVLSLDKYTEAGKEAQRKIKEIQDNKLLKLEKQLRGIVSKKEIEESRSFKDDADKFEEKIEKRVRELKDKLKTSISILSNEKESIEDEIISIHDKIKDIESTIVKTDDKEGRIKKLKSKLNNKKNELSDLVGDLKYKENKINDLKKYLKLIETKSICPLCKQDIKKDVLLSRTHKGINKLNREVKSLRDKIVSYKEEICNTQEKIDNMKKKLDRVYSLINEKDFLNRRLIDLKNRLYNIEQQKTTLKNEIEDEINNELTKENIYAKLEKERLENIKHLSRKENELKKHIKKIENEIAYYDFWTTNFRKLQIKLFNKIVEMFEMFTNEILSKYNPDIQVFFSTESETKSGKIKEGFDISIKDTDGRILPFEMFSGGEKKRISLAISLALSKIIQNQCGIDYGIIMLDEPNDELDDVGKEINFKILEDITKDGMSVFVIDHDAYFRERFDDTILVEYKNGESSIITN